MMADSIEEKIRKLLAKANNTACTVEEAAAFNAKAYELMEKHNIDRATIDKEKEAVRNHLELQVVVRPWSSAVLHGLCHLYFCKWYYTRIGRTDTVTLVGEESNVAVCHALAVMILRAIQQEARATGGGRSFMTGAGAMIRARALEMRPTNQLAAPVGSNVRALIVLGDSETQANAQYIAQLTGGALRKAKSSGPKVRSAAAFGAGQAYGKTLPMRQNLLGRG